MYTLQTRKSAALASQMAAGATSCTLAAATFGTPTGQQIITIDGGDILKAADFKCTISGTAVTAMTLLNGVDVIHAAAAPVTMNFVDEHYSALTDFVGARAFLAATLATTVSAAATKVALDTETGTGYDIGGNFADGKFVAPVNGYYDIDAHIVYGNITAAAKKFYCYIYIGGALAKIGIGQSSVAGGLSVSASDRFYVAKDSYVEMYYYHDDATTVDITGTSTYTSLTVNLVKEV